MFVNTCQKTKCINFSKSNCMTVEVKKKVDKKRSEQILSSLPDKIKPIDLSKFAGKLKWKGDPLKIQKEWRDE